MRYVVPLLSALVLALAPSVARGEVYSLVESATPTAPAYVVTDLGVLPGTTRSEARAINAAGQVVGWSGDFSADPPGLYPHAVLWDVGQVTALDPLLGNSEAHGINDDGQVVGTTRAATEWRAVLWAPT